MTCAGRAVRSNQEAIQVKTNKDRGGAIRNVHLRDISVAHAGHHLLYITNAYHSFRGGQSPTEITGLDLERINCRYAATSFCLQGLAEMPLRDIRLRDIHVEKSPCPGICHVNCEDVAAENIRVNGETIGLE